jgi:L-ascorbate metabolism protein UlaG (beta-lactamase superfamily)
MRITYIGGPTALIEIGGWRIITDPTFDPPGKRYFFGWGTASKKLQGPAVPFEQLEPIDAVLLTHDHHGDNLDPTARDLLPRMGQIVTTVPGAKRVGGTGLAPWDTTTLEAEGKTPLEITATPCRHGPGRVGFAQPIVGHVIGFGLSAAAHPDEDLWISGDTVLYDGVREVATRLKVRNAMVHLGGVKFWWLSGPLRYTMDAQEAVELCGLLNPEKIIPIHYEGWKHFRQPRSEAERVLAGSSLGSRVVWLTAGEPTDV